MTIAMITELSGWTSRRGTTVRTKQEISITKAATFFAAMVEYQRMTTRLGSRKIDEKKLIIFSFTTSPYFLASRIRLLRELSSTTSSFSMFEFLYPFLLYPFHPSLTVKNHQENPFLLSLSLLLKGNVVYEWTFMYIGHTN